MKLITFYITLLSSILFALEANARFKKVSNADFSLVSDVSEVKNLPKVRSQDSLGICYGMSSNVVAQHFYCEKKKLDCANLTSKQMISPLSSAAFAKSDDPDEAVRSIGKFRNIDVRNSSSSGMALYNLSGEFTLFADSCFPFDQVTQKYGTDEAAVNEMLRRLEDVFEKNKKMEAGACIDCVQKEVQKSFGVSLTPNIVARALRQENFNQFFYRVTIGTNRCEDFVSLSGADRPGYKYYPTGKETANYEQKVQYLKNVLKNGRPADLAGVCIKPGASTCEVQHSVAVTGYRKQCTAKGQCRELLRIQNSWGEDWQKAFNDGWVDAKTLLDNNDNHIISHLVPLEEVVAAQ